MHKNTINIDLTGISLNEIGASLYIVGRLESSRIIPGNIPPKPAVVLGLVVEGKVYIMLTRGSMSLIKAAQKAGKTAVMIVFATVVINGKVFSNYGVLCCESPGAVVHIDTEQGSYYGALTATRAARHMRSTQNYYYYDFRPYNAEERRVLLEEALNSIDNVALLIVDGLRDLMRDFNDIGESGEIVNWLMGLSVKHNCHICLVQHTNKADTNARGHAGAETSNKVETGLHVTKDAASDSIIIKSEFTRGLPIPDFMVKREDDGTPVFYGCATKKEKPKTKPQDFTFLENQEMAIAVFDKDEKMKPNDLIDGIMTLCFNRGIPSGNTRSKDFKRYWEHLGIVENVGGHTSKAIYELQII